MKVLFISCEEGADRSCSAYTHRLAKLRCALEEHAIQTEFMSLREQLVGRPLLAQPLNLPFIRQKAADCSFIHAGGNAAYTVAFLKRHTQARIIHDVHGDTSSEAQWEFALRKDALSAYRFIQARIVDAVGYRYADYFLAVSKPMQQRMMKERHISAEKIGLVRNGVDLELFNAVPFNGNRTDKFVVTYAGSFRHWQGIENLIQAAELLPRNGLRIRIIGFASSDAPLRSRVAERLSDKVELVDRVNQRELVSHLATAHVLIIPRPSHRAVEVAFPTKFSEYLALGKPVIVCDVDETAHLIRQHHCGLVSKPNPVALAKTIQAASKLTPAELSEMGQNARRLAALEFSWKAIGQTYAELLQKWNTR